MSLFSSITSWFQNNWSLTAGPANRSAPVQFFEYGSQPQWQSLTGSQSYYRLFNQCSPLAGVVIRKAEAFVNGRLQVSAPSPRAAKEWQAFLAQPNPRQSSTEFFKQLYTFLAMRGFVYALPVYAEGFTDDVPSALWLLPPWMVEIETIPKNTLKNGDFTPTRKIIFQSNGMKSELKEASLILFTEDNTSLDPYTMLPLGRIYTLRYAISNLIGSLESRNTLIYRRGAMGILTPELKDGIGSTPMNEAEKEQLQQDYSRYGLTKNQWSALISNTPLKWQSIAMSPRELMLMEEHESTIRDICDVYNYPYELLSQSRGATYANKDEAKKLLYQDSIIPESKNILGQLAHQLGLTEQGIELCLDYSHIEALQESLKETGEGRKAMNEALQIEYQNGLITLDDWREMSGLSRINKPPFTKYISEIAA